MTASSVLIVSDDTDFARTLTARWQSERHVPEITLVTSSVWHPASASNYDLVIVGPVRNGSPAAILAAVSALASHSRDFFRGRRKATLRRSTPKHPHLLVVPRQDGWAGTLILVSIEALRRVEAVRRAQRAEGLALASQRPRNAGALHAGNAPGRQRRADLRAGQRRPVSCWNPAKLRARAASRFRPFIRWRCGLNEIMQRFSSLATEMRAGEKESQAETAVLSHRLVTRS